MQRRSAVGTSTIALLAALIMGCGGGSSNKSTVAQVNLNPASISVIAGQVAALSVSAVDSSSNPVAPLFTFNSSNPRLVTVSPSGLVCGGVWDATFVTCNGLDASGNPLVGTATVTATAAGVTSGPVSVTVHPTVTSVTITNPPANGTCFSGNQTLQLNAKAFNNANDITSQVGGFTWSSTSPVVVTVDANGMATARSPGLAQIVAHVGASSSPGVSFKTCMPVRLTLHVPGDPPGQPTESATMNVKDTQTLEVDMTDENGTVVNNAPGIRVFSNNAAVVTASGSISGTTTLNAVSSGGAGIMAGCIPPTCGFGINQPVYSNLFGVTVNGDSPATTVYVASKDLADVSTIIPIDTSKTPPVAGDQITLPGHPNSFIFSADGLKAFIGTDAGLVSLDATSNTVTLAAPEAVGTVLAVSPDGNMAIVSNAPNDPDPLNHRLRFFDQRAQTLTTFILHNAVAAAFNADGFKAYVGTSDGHIYVFSPSLTLQTLSPGGSFTSVAMLPSGSFALLASSTALNTFNVCDNTQAASAPTNSAPLLLSSILNTDKIVALDSTGVNIEAVNVGAPASGFCPPAVSFSNQFIDFGAGPFTANQLIVPGNGAHIVVLPKGQNQIFSAVPGGGPGTATLAAGATEALAGSMTQDGNTLWVGVQGDHTLHRINLLTLTDEFQMQPNVNGAQSTPDIVAVRPK